MSFFNSPKHACWDITSACNESCRFCYRVTGQRDLPLSAHLEIASKLSDAGVRKVSIVGGEPLLVEHLPAIIKLLKNRGVSTSVVTNGILLRSRIAEFSTGLDWITLPLDGHDETSQIAMSRAPGHFTRVVELAPKVLELGMRLKINSVVSFINHRQIRELSACVAAIGPDRWKLFEFSAIRGAASKNSVMFSLPTRAFSEGVMPAVSAAVESGIRVTVADSAYMSANYFSISPNGDVRVSIEGRDHIVGSLLDSTVETLWKQAPLDHERHWRIRNSIPDSFYESRLAAPVAVEF